MTLRSATEARISAALSNLSDVDMQRVAEDYVRIRWKAYFNLFSYRAVNEEGKSRAGWPDAWREFNGKIYGVEATSARTKSGVRKHLQDYLDRIKSCSQRVSVFIHVSGHPAVQLDQHEIITWRKRFIHEGGIDSDKLELVFGGGLVEDLARPEFARTRVEVLGLSESPTHFRLVSSKKAPDEGRLRSAFLPSDEDYLAGRVHRPQLADGVLARLEATGCALVRGVGASGKSVMAWLLALDFAERRMPSYMIDLADHPLAIPEFIGGIVNDLIRFGDPQALFVIDNCHLNETVVKDIILSWQGLAPDQRPRLLILGRELRSRQGSLIDGLGLEPLTLRAQQPELLGVYRRLAWQKPGTPPPTPPSEIVDGWVDEFGGKPNAADTTTDLIAFSAAVLRRMKQLLDGDWRLTVRDAVEEIRSVYLSSDRISPGEYNNLMRLCALAELELNTPSGALPDQRAGFDKSNERYGLVFRNGAVGIGRGVYYTIAHPALARLIISSAYASVDAAAERLAAALSAPSVVAEMLIRLRGAGLVQEADVLCSSFMKTPQPALSLPSLWHLEHTLREAALSGCPVTKEFGDQAVSGDGPRRLAEMALATPPHFIARFLGYAAQIYELRPVSHALSTELTNPHNVEMLAKGGVSTSPDLLVALLEFFSRTPGFKPVFEKLLAELAKPELLELLNKQVIKTPLNLVVKTLKYFEKAEPRNLNPVFFSSVRALRRPENIEILANQALETPLDSLENFLSYVAQTDALKVVFRGVSAKLSNNANLGALSVAMQRQPLDALTNVLVSTTAPDLWRAALGNLDAGEWERARLSEPRPKLDAFVAFQRVVSDLGHRQLAQAPAVRIVRSLPKDDWHQHTIGLHHLTHVLRLARPALSPEEVEAFLDDVAAPEWVDRLIRTIRARALSGNFLALWILLGKDERRRFIRPALAQRICAQLVKLPTQSGQTLAESISLLGTATELGLSLPPVQVIWPSKEALDDVIASRMPEPDQPKIGSRQIQLWLGLRELAALGREYPKIDPALAQLSLELWRATASAADDSLPNHIVQLNTRMLSWLEECKAGGWCLARPV